MKRQKILMLGWEYPPHNSGGLGVACEGIVKSLLEENSCDITFVLPRKVDVDTGTETVFVDQYNTGTVTYHYFDSILSPYITHSEYKKKLDESEPQIEYAEDIMSEVRRYQDYALNLVDSVDFDVIHAHDWLTVPPALALKQATGKPLVLHIHSTEIDRAGEHGYQDIIDIEYQGIQQADKIIAVSELTKNTIIDRYAGKSECVEVIYNGIDRHAEEKQQPDEDILETLKKQKEQGYKVVLFVGRLTYQKGVEYLLKAAQKACTKVDKALFIIVGSGELEYSLVELASYLGISEKVVFTGFIRGAQKKSLYMMADLFIMPSVTEPFGIVALEAVIHNTPVLLTKTSGAGEVLRHALQVEYGDVDEAAHLIVSVLTFESLRHVMLANSQKNIDDLKWSKAASQITSVYETL